MKLLGFLLVFAQVTTAATATSWEDAFARIVTAGGFGALVWYLVVRHIPSIEERHAKEREQEREEFTKTIDKMAQTIEDHTKEIRRHYGEKDR